MKNKISFFILCVSLLPFSIFANEGIKKCNAMDAAYCKEKFTSVKNNDWESCAQKEKEKCIMYLIYEEKIKDLSFCNDISDESLRPMCLNKIYERTEYAGNCAEIEEPYRNDCYGVLVSQIIRGRVDLKADTSSYINACNIFRNLTSFHPNIPMLFVITDVNHV